MAQSSIIDRQSATAEFAGRHVLITGAGSGIGRAAAVAFATRGASVLVTDADPAAAAATLGLLPIEGTGRHQALPLDVTDASAWERALEAARAGGGLDVLLNAAGVSHAADLPDIPPAEWRRVFAVNVDGIFLGLRLVLPLMRRQARGGAIINVSSASGVKAVAGAAAYCASKAAAIMLGRVAAAECARDATGIRVNTVVPGAVRTPMWRGMRFFGELVKEKGSEEAAWAALAATMPLGRFADPEEVAAGILYLASDAARYVTGTELAIDGGYLGQ